MDNLLDLINGSVGENVKYDDDYIDLSDEIEKLSSPISSDSVDFNKINSLSKSILLNKSKDFFVAVYYSYSLLRLDINYLKESLCFISDFFDKFFNDGFPKKEKAKFNALNWWLVKIIPILKNMPSIQTDDNLYFECVEKLENFCSSYEEAPSLFELKSLLKDKIVKPEQEIKAEKTQEQKNISISQTIEEVNSENAEEIFKTSLDKINETITFLLDKNYKAEYFILDRISYIYDINDLPMATNKQTLIAPPSHDEINAIETLYKSENYKELLELCESKIRTYIFWLDLHYYVYVSLNHLGYKNCADAIKCIMSMFVDKLIGIEEYRFSDGTSFANKETKKWLKPQMQTLKIDKNDKFKLPNGNKKELVSFINNKILTSKDINEEINWIILFLENCNNDEILKIYGVKLFNLLRKFNIEKIDIDLAIKSYNSLLDVFNEDDEIFKSAKKVLTLINTKQFM